MYIRIYFLFAGLEQLEAEAPVDGRLSKNDYL